jgi:hypothetical protein
LHNLACAICFGFHLVQTYVGHTYVLNSDEGLTERAQ